jgi:hypothetical protein
MIEHPRGLRFLLEAPQSVFILRESGRQDFDCHFAAKSGVTRAVDFTHAARAKRRENFKWAKLNANSDSHRGRPPGKMYSKLSSLLMFSLGRITKASANWKVCCTSGAAFSK